MEQQQISSVDFNLTKYVQKLDYACSNVLPQSVTSVSS